MLWVELGPPKRYVEIPMIVTFFCKQGPWRCDQERDRERECHVVTEAGIVVL